MMPFGGAMKVAREEAQVMRTVFGGEVEAVLRRMGRRRVVKR